MKAFVVKVAARLMFENTVYLVLLVETKFGDLAVWKMITQLPPVAINSKNTGSMTTPHL